MILVDKQIGEVVAAEHVRIDPFEAKQIQPASYDLRVGAQGISTTSKQVVNIKEKGYFELRPGDFAVVLTREMLSFNDSYTARIGLRSKYARKGIIATTGPQIDPGFNGRLKIGITNLSPHAIAMPFEDDFITIEIHKLHMPCQKPYAGDYQGDTELSPRDIEAVAEGDNIGFAKMLDTMRALSKNVSELTMNVDKQIKQSEIVVKQNKSIMWLVGIGLAIIGLMTGLIGLVIGLS